MSLTDENLDRIERNAALQDDPQTTDDFLALVAEVRRLRVLDCERKAIIQGLAEMKIVGPMTGVTPESAYAAGRASLAHGPVLESPQDGMLSWAEFAASRMGELALRHPDRVARFIGELAREPN